MQAKLNIILKLAKELGLSVAAESPFKAIEAMDETDRLRLSIEDLIDEFNVDEELCDDLTQKLNEIKKKGFEIKILESGRSVDSTMELKDLKSRGVGNLVTIPREILDQVKLLESQIRNEQENLRSQRKKSKETIAEENNLLPNLNFRVGVSLLLTLFAGVFVILGYIASTDERFYDKDFGYWSMLLGGLGLLITLNLLIIRIVQAIKFQINKRKAVEDLADKFISKLEAEYEALEGKTRSKIFSLESLAYSEGCKKQFLESKNEMKELRVNVVAHFK
tara:strand:+ start:87 stop:920 length:834 start_codon:yes stop_codon:yes gene_type:complete